MILVRFGKDGLMTPLPEPSTLYCAIQSFSSAPGSCHSSDFSISANTRTPLALLTLAEPSGLKYRLFGAAEQTKRSFQLTAHQKAVTVEMSPYSCLSGRVKNAAMSACSSHVSGTRSSLPYLSEYAAFSLGSANRSPR